MENAKTQLGSMLHDAPKAGTQPRSQQKASTKRAHAKGGVILALSANKVKKGSDQIYLVHARKENNKVAVFYLDMGRQVTLTNERRTPSQVKSAPSRFSNLPLPRTPAPGFQINNK